MKNEKLIRKWLSSDLTKEEEKLFKQTKEYSDLNKIWESLSIAKSPKYSIEEELEHFHKNHSSQPTKIKSIGLGSWIGIAASIVLIVALTFIFQLNFTDSNVTLSQNAIVHYLPDSSQVILNRGSIVSYKSKDWLSDREVLLEGEGYFKVKKGSTFKVKSENGTVSVLGTAFNIKQNKGYYEVRCFEGKVAVESLSQNISLVAGKGFRNLNGDIKEFKLKDNSKPSWMMGKSSFERVPYKYVLEEIETQYDVKVQAENIDLMRTFSGSFPNDELEVALKSITVPSNYSFKITDEKIIILGEDK